MRKLFSILSAVLVSLAMQASITKTDLNLSGLTRFYSDDASVTGTTITAKAWRGAQLENINYDATDYDYLMLEVADHAQEVLLKVIYSDDSSDQATMRTNYNTVALYLSKKSIKTIQVINWSSTDATITVNSISLGKAFRDSEEVILSNESRELTNWVWEERLQIAADKFSNVFVGDMLKVYVTTNATDANHQISIQLEAEPHDYLSFAQEIVTSTDESQDIVLYFPIFAQEDLANIQSNSGIYLSGQNITCTKVSVIHHDVFWSGSKSEDWSAIEVPASSFSSVTVGDILNIRLTAAEAGTQVELLKGNWGKFTPHLWYYFKETPDPLPTTIQFVMNQSTVDDLRANGLIARGANNFTITDIYIDAETATTTSYNLTVTAGMATLVLPFKVPSLPSGVEAYTLSIRESDHAIMAEQVDVIEADKPVLIVAEASETPYTFESESGGDANISGKAGIYRNEALAGTYTEINPLAQKTDDNFNYILQKPGEEAAAFYQVQDESCHVDPYRAYLSISYDKAHDNGGGPAAPMRIVFWKGTPTGVESQELKANSQKILRNGQILILRDGRTYNILGSLIH